MATIHLIRTSRKNKAVRGTMRVGERDIATLENADYIIPDGTYTVSVTYSPRFKKMMPLIGNVPRRSGIRIHGGTKPEHSTGCVLVSNPKDREKITEFINQNKQNKEKTFIHISSDGRRGSGHDKLQGLAHDQHDCDLHASGRQHKDHNYYRDENSGRIYRS